MNINYSINQLIRYGINNGLIEEYDAIYCANKLIDILGVKTFEFEETKEIPINELLKNICDYAYENKIIDRNDVTTYDLFDTKVMDAIMPRPSDVLYKFNSIYNKDKVLATNYYYNLSIKSNYIRKDRLDKNICFKYNSKYGPLDITINLSKPEKDPKLIALMKTLPSTGYPKCLLCYENMGFVGNLNHPARQNHRIIPLKLNNEDYFIQYSPYGYYNEHAIVFNKNHKPMVINRETFAKLLDFVSQYDHYFIGSNADLPIVGGSILSHDHFQGGRYNFAMFDSNTLKEFKLKEFPNCCINYINWPLDTLCVKGADKNEVVCLADLILSKWKNYSKKEINLLCETNGVPHNTITPIVRKKDGLYELYLVLRNNRTDEEHPYGIFHPDEKLHHIKKENIGLIEVMGLAVLPKRLEEEMLLLKQVLQGVRPKEYLDVEPLSKHKDWAKNELFKYSFTKDNVDSIVNEEIGKVFMNVLEDCGVFKYGNKIKEIEDFIDFIRK